MIPPNRISALPSITYDTYDGTMAVIVSFYVPNSSRIDAKLIGQFKKNAFPESFFFKKMRSVNFESS
jgi:hypothetical protein